MYLVRAQVKSISLFPSRTSPWPQLIRKVVSELMCEILSALREAGCGWNCVYGKSKHARIILPLFVTFKSTWVWDKSWSWRAIIRALFGEKCSKGAENPRIHVFDSSKTNIAFPTCTTNKNRFILNIIIYCNVYERRQAEFHCIKFTRATCSTLQAPPIL